MIEIRNKHFFTTKEAEEAGLSRRMLVYYLEKGKLERISRGLYRNLEAKDLDLNEESWIDLVAITKKVNGVICLISALKYYDITDEFMNENWIAIAHSYGGDRRKIPNTRTIRMKNLSLGVKTIKMCGVSVKIFDVERTIIDTFRLLDIETALKALKFYLKSSDHKTNIRKLNKYAKELRVDISSYIMAMMI